MNIITETERLILREIKITDLEDMYELHSDPDVHIYLGNKFITTRKEAVEIINFIQKKYIDHGVARWAMIDKQTSEFIGWTGLDLVVKETNKHINYYDLGYRLKKKFWGNGYATESAIASLKYAFDNLHAENVYGIADCRNDVSNKILKKVGLTFIETFDLEGVEHNWYRISKNTM